MVSWKDGGKCIKRDLAKCRQVVVRAAPACDILGCILSVVWDAGRLAEGRGLMFWSGSGAARYIQQFVSCRRAIHCLL